MSDVREALWGVVQGAIADLDFDFGAYAERAPRPPAGATPPTPDSRGGCAMPRPRELPDRARVVIIGGGVGGTSIAYHLAELGERDVVLVDRDELTSGSTFHSAGLVGQLRSSVSLTRMMMYSVELYRDAGLRLGRVRRHPAGLHARARGGGPPPGRPGRARSGCRSS